MILEEFLSFLRYKEYTDERLSISLFNLNNFKNIVPHVYHGFLGEFVFDEVPKKYMNHEVVYMFPFKHNNLAIIILEIIKVRSD